MIGWGGLLVEYADWLDLEGVTDIVTLQEGNTPLLFADALSNRLGANVWLKFEGLNPTGSFKDRGMTVAVTRGTAEARRVVPIVTRTGRGAERADAPRSDECSKPGH